jgi:3',5'-cyclic AMP phosphodiesterase CpdA
VIRARYDARVQRALAIAITLGLGLVLSPTVRPGVRPAAADDTFADDEPDNVPDVRPIGDGVELIGKSTSWSWKAVNAPRLDRQIGAVAIAGLDLILGRRKDAVAVTGPEVPPPKGWPIELGGGDHGAGPFAAPDDKGECDCKTSLPIGENERVAVMYAQASFTLERDHKDLRVLELRSRYRDGMIVWLNGVEVATRGLDGPGGDRIATRTRGPEWEILRIPAAPGLLRQGANQLAVEVRPSGRSRAPLLDVELVGRRKHGIARGPFIQRVGDTTATVVVETELFAPATLHWGQGHATDHEMVSPAGRRHVFDLTGLAPQSQVSYRVDAGDDTTADIRFHTAPGPREALRIAVYGDVRGGHQTHRALLDAMRGESPDLVIATGDLVLRGTDEGDWQRFFAVTEDMFATVPFYPAIGNHDVGRTGEELRTADQVFALPPPPANRPASTFWYSYDVANVHLVFLDSNTYERREQREWFETDLADARKRKVRAIIVSTHDGPYSRGSHRGSTIAQRDYVPIMTKYRVDLVLSGHDHIYQRGSIGGIDYIVSGGGGAQLYSQACGAPNKRKCAVEDGMQFFAKAHHYVMVTIDRGQLETCARRADGTAVEPCVKQKLKR